MDNKQKQAKETYSPRQWTPNSDGRFKGSSMLLNMSLLPRGRGEEQSKESLIPQLTLLSSLPGIYFSEQNCLIRVRRF